ncbi:cytochrome P450 2K1-like, partial [Scleropages formosus]
ARTQIRGLGLRPIRHCARGPSRHLSPFLVHSQVSSSTAANQSGREWEWLGGCNKNLKAMRDRRKHLQTGAEGFEANMSALTALMEDSASVTVVLVFATLLFLVLLFKPSSKGNKYKFPPGPRPWPIIGNINILNVQQPHDTMCKLSEQYGDVFTFHMGTRKYVVITGYEAVKQALITQAEEFGERGITPAIHLFVKSKGLVFGVGESWKTMRRFTLTTLRDFGMGRSTIEDRIVEEAQRLLDIFQQHQGKPFDPTVNINSAVSNIICHLVFGHRFEYDDPVFLQLQRRVNEVIQLIASPELLVYNLFPKLGAMLADVNKIKENLEKNRSYFGSVCHQHKAELNNNDLRSFLDSFLARQKEEQPVAPDQRGHDLQRLPPPQGRRACVGETLAKMELFLFFTALLQRFRFHPPQGIRSEDLGLSSLPGLTNLPRPYELSLMADSASVTVVLVFATLLFLVLLFKPSSKGNKYKFPPGPRPWPIIGNLNILNVQRPDETMCKLSKQYGDVFTFHMGTKKYVVITGYEAVKQALITQAEEFGERGITPINQIVNNGKGLAFGVGESWKTMRRFTLTTLRDFGMGRSTIEDRIVEEAQRLLDIFQQHQGKPFDPTVNIYSAVSNIICQLVFGHRFKYNDPVFLQLQNRVIESTQLLASPEVLVYNLYPKLGTVLGDFQKLHKNITENQKYFRDIYAVVHEIQRFGNVVPSNLLRQTKHDTTFRDYHLPKGTPVIPLLTSVLFDKTQWETPVCVGETLAKMELFLFFTALLQKFCFEPPEGIRAEDLDLTPALTFTRSPKPYELCAVVRAILERDLGEVLAPSTLGNLAPSEAGSTAPPWVFFHSQIHFSSILL